MAKPNSKEVNIRTYYTEVNKFGQNGEYDKAIKSLNKSKWFDRICYLLFVALLICSSFVSNSSECGAGGYNGIALQGGLFDSNI